MLIKVWTRVAERSAISYVEEFHLEMFKQMGVRMFSFIAYRRPDGKNVVCKHLPID